MNVSSLKTPGVYINEIDAFPPSVAQVATAIPAFIGYTEKGPSVPVRISSLLEFQQIFGSAPSPDNITINMGSNIYEVAESKFKLYNSLNLFYANGGGVCYIVSIGQFSSNPTFASSDDLGRQVMRPVQVRDLIATAYVAKSSGSTFGEVVTAPRPNSPDSVSL